MRSAASDRRGAQRRKTLAVAAIGAAAASAASSADAAMLCTDDWGNKYVLEQASAAMSTLLRCETIEATAPAAAPANRPGPKPATPSRGSAANGLRGPTVYPNGMALRTDWAGLPRDAGLRIAPPPGGWRSAAATATPALQSMIDEVAEKYGHDARLLSAIIHVESRFNPEAVSPKGAIGLMQVMPATGERMGVAAGRLSDPASNLHAGARYLRLLMDMFDGEQELAIAAYNAGEGAVIRHGRRIPPYAETQNYVRQVLELYENGMR